MKVGTILSYVAVAALAGTMAQAGTSKMDFAKVYEKECQGCHGPIHQGGVGSDLRPKALKKKNEQMLVDTILNGKPGTAMPEWKHMFSRRMRRAWSIG
jgi:nitrite reductase (NO-forming)/hydroxylamine reductase